MHHAGRPFYAFCIAQADLHVNGGADGDLLPVLINDPDIQQPDITQLIDIAADSFRGLLLVIVIIIIVFADF